MTTATADSLVAYINRHSTRFTANIQEYGEQTWVLLRDRDQAFFKTLYIEPILDLQAYLDREGRSHPLIPELRELLETWSNL
jgi:hypothetical protein